VTPEPLNLGSFYLLIELKSYHFEISFTIQRSNYCIATFQTVAMHSNCSK